MSGEFDPYRKWLGIPPEEQPPHHYRLLGIAPLEGDADVIENAADRQMAHVRRYQSGRYSEQSQRVLNELSAAKICLLNPARKADYDSQLREKLAHGAAAKAPPPAAPPMTGPPDAVPPGAPPLPADDSSFRGAPAVGGAAPYGSTTPVPSFRGASRGRRRGGRRNRMLVPIVITVVSLLALVITIAVAGIIIATRSDSENPPANGKSGDSGKTDKDKARLKSSDKTSGIDNSPGRKAGVRDIAAQATDPPASTAAWN